MLRFTSSTSLSLSVLGLAFISPLGSQVAASSSCNTPLLAAAAATAAFFILY